MNEIKRTEYVESIRFGSPAQDAKADEYNHDSNEVRFGSPMQDSLQDKKD